MLELAVYPTKPLNEECRDQYQIKKIFKILEQLTKRDRVQLNKKTRDNGNSEWIHACLLVLNVLFLLQKKKEKQNHIIVWKELKISVNLFFHFYLRVSKISIQLFWWGGGSTGVSLYTGAGPSICASP
jgi:hypothetical protein